MHRYLSSSSLRRAWAALGGDEAPPPTTLEAIVEAAAEAALHAAAAAYLVEVAKQRPFGARSEHMALVAADLVYRSGGWVLPEGRAEQFDALVRRAAAGQAAVHEVADELATLARPGPADD